MYLKYVVSLRYSNFVIDNEDDKTLCSDCLLETVSCLHAIVIPLLNIVETNKQTNNGRGRGAQSVDEAAIAVEFSDR